MAEGEGSAAEAGATGGPSMDEITAGLIAGQSKSTGEEFLKFSQLESPGEGKNKLVMVCLHCRCKVIRPGYATLVDKELFMPHMMEKHKIGSEPAGDTLTSQWLVEDMYHFENVGFTKNVNATEKYLVCADCEVGPIGWTDVNNRKEYYVSAERVCYSAS